jgi:hypothetical protein
MLGLAAVAAVAAMAFVGASSAVAGSTALCATHEDPCTTPYTGHIEGLAENPELLSTLANVKCEHSVILGNALGLVENGPQVTHLELLDFTGDCLTELKEKCTVTAVKLGLLLLLRTALNKGELEAHDTEVNVHCGLVINCTYGGLPVTKEVEGSVSGGLGTITAKEVVLTKTGGLLCPKTSKWDAKYTIVLPDPVYITT